MASNEKKISSKKLMLVRQEAVILNGQIENWFKKFFSL